MGGKIYDVIWMAGVCMYRILDFVGPNDDATYVVI